MEEHEFTCFCRIIDETDQYVDVAHKIKVVRKPLQSRATTKGLAPLIKGSIVVLKIPLYLTDHGEWSFQVLSRNADIQGIMDCALKPAMGPRMGKETP